MWRARRQGWEPVALFNMLAAREERSRSHGLAPAVLAAVRHHPDRAALMARLGLDEQSVVLVINTEGDTDVAHYREVVWEGKHPACD